MPDAKIEMPEAAREKRESLLKDREAIFHHEYHKRTKSSFVEGFDAGYQAAQDEITHDAAVLASLNSLALLDQLSTIKRQAERIERLENVLKEVVDAPIDDPNGLAREIAQDGLDEK